MAIIRMRCFRLGHSVMPAAMRITAIETNRNLTGATLRVS